VKQLDHKGGVQGIETINRINYDDVNESMTNRYLVHRTLKKLKIDGSKVKQVNDAYEAITKLPLDAEVTFQISISILYAFLDRRDESGIRDGFLEKICFCQDFP